MIKCTNYTKFSEVADVQKLSKNPRFYRRRTGSSIVLVLIVVGWKITAVLGWQDGSNWCHVGLDTEAASAAAAAAAASVRHRSALIHSATTSRATPCARRTMLAPIDLETQTRISVTPRSTRNRLDNDSTVQQTVVNDLSIMIIFNSPINGRQ